MAQHQSEEMQEFAQTLKTMRAECADEDRSGLDLALTAMGEDAEIAGYDDEYVSSTDLDPDMPDEPVRKGVVGTTAAGIVLVLTWVLSEISINIPLDVQGALALLIGAGFAWYQKEY